MTSLFKCSKESLVIAVSGKPGSGKTTLAKSLANELGLRYISSGGIFREIASNMGVSLVELSRIAEGNYDIDRYIDSYIRSEAVKGGIVVDGHISAWILRDIAHIKICAMAPLDVRARRIAERDNIALSNVLEIVRSIEESESRRFKAIYNIDLNDYTIFDIIINTHTFNPKECLEIALKAISKVLDKCVSESL